MPDAEALHGFGDGVEDDRYQDGAERQQHDIGQDPKSGDQRRDTEQDEDAPHEVRVAIPSDPVRPIIQAVSQCA